MSTATLTITPLVVPASLDADDAADFRAYGALNQQICGELVGLPEIAPDAAQMLASWQDTTDRLCLGFVARRGDDVVGMASVEYDQEEGARTADVDVLVPREHFADGVADDLLAHVEGVARSRGRTTLQTWSLHRPVSAERMLVPPTGFGKVPANWLSDLFERHGYSLEQVERNSEYDLRADPAPLQHMLDEAIAAAGADYRRVSWMLPTPPEFRDEYAQVIARLVTDAPSGDMEVVEQTWDAARVVRRDAQLTSAGQAVSVSAVQHVPTGRIVAYNELIIGADRAEVTHQYGTLVLKEHRGHRLGMIVKCDNLLRWRELFPLSTRVSTFNAEENRPMLDINEALGFAPVSYAAGWQKRI